MNLAFNFNVNLKPGAYFVTVRLMDALDGSKERVILKINRAGQFTVSGNETFYGITDLSRGMELVE